MKLATVQAQLRARTAIQKADQLERVNAGVARISAIAVRWAREDLWPVIGWARGRDEVHVARRVAEVLGLYWSRVQAGLEELLADHARWSWDQGYQVLVDTLPRAYWYAMARARNVPLRESVDYSGAGELQVVKDLYRPMTLPEVRTLMFKPPAQAPDGLSWRDRLDRYSRLTTAPGEVADMIRLGLQKGKNPNDVAKDLLGFVQGNQAAATRIARGEMLRIGQDGLREQWAGFEDVITGYEIRATFDERTRPHHRTRHGDRYLNLVDGKLPQGAKGTPDQRPMVPDEFNCRCYESPILKELPGVFEDVVTDERTVATIDGNQDDPVTMSRWFDAQDDGRKRRILGPGRMKTLEVNLERAGYGRRVTWADAVDPKSGEFVLVRDLRVESIPQTVARRTSNTWRFEQRAATITAERPELFPGLKLIDTPPPLPPVPPGPPAPPPVTPPKGLTSGQVQALEDWQADGHARTRDYYRPKTNNAWPYVQTKGEVGKEIRKVDRALSKLPTVTTRAGNAATSFRGLKDLGAEDLNRLLGADVLEFDNFQAASRSRKVAEAFADGRGGTENVLLRMKSANGRDLSVIGGRAAQEETVMFERGRRWKVVKRATSATSSGGRLHELWLEEVPPSKDSPLFSGKTAPRRRLWAPPPAKTPAPATWKPPPKPAFDADPSVAIARAKDELRQLGLRQEDLRTGQVEGRPAHDVFWSKLREVNGTKDTKTGVRAGVMKQRKKILDTYDRKRKAIEKEVREIEARLPARGSPAWDALASSAPAKPRWQASGDELEYLGLVNREKRLKRLALKRGVQAKWFADFAEVADETLVQDPLLGEIKWGIGKKQRAGAYRWTNEIKCWRIEDEDLYVFAHEFGHHVEYRNPRVNERLVRWRKERGRGRPMKSVYPGSPHSSEIGWPDDWYNGYCGRVYAGRDSTEILSMGMQFTTTAEELAEVATKDFDHVAMIWAILRGY